MNSSCHLHKLSLNFHNNYSVGRLMSRSISDVGILQDFVTWSITGLAPAVFILIGTIIAMVVLNWQLALVTFTLIPLMLWLAEFWRARVRTAYRVTRLRLALINGYLNESICIVPPKALGGEVHNFRHFDDLNTSFFDANLNATWLMAVFWRRLSRLAGHGAGDRGGRLAGAGRYPDRWYAGGLCARWAGPLLSADPRVGPAL